MAIIKEPTFNQITFSDYTTALFANKDFETTPGKFELPKQALNLLTSYTLQQSAFSEFTKGAIIENVSAATIIYRKLVSGTFKEKTTIGVIGDIEAMTFPTEEIKFTKPQFVRQGLTQADLNLGLPNASSQKLERFLIDYMNAYDEDGFKQMETVIKANALNKKELNFLTATPQEIYNQIVNLATSLTLLIDKKEGIKYVTRDKIKIAVDPIVFDKIATLGIIGNRAGQSFEQGQYGIGTLAGYHIFSAPSIQQTEFKVIVGTDFSCGGTIKLNAANIGRIGNTNDLEVYFEAMKASGVVFKSTLKGIIQTTTSS